MGHLGGTLVAFITFVAIIRRLGCCSFFVAFRVFVAFMGHWCGILVAFTALVVFMGHWGWTFVAFKVCIFYGVFGVDVCGFHSFCSVYEAFWLVLLVAFRVLIAFRGY